MKVYIETSVSGFFGFVSSETVYRCLDCGTVLEEVGGLFHRKAKNRPCQFIGKTFEYPSIEVKEKP